MNSSYLDSLDKKRLRQVEQSKRIKIVNVTVVKYGYVFYAEDHNDRDRLKKYKFRQNKLEVIR